MPGDAAKGKNKPGAAALLFDLGQVIIEVDFERAFATWAAAHGEEQAVPWQALKAAWQADHMTVDSMSRDPMPVDPMPVDPMYEAHELGAVSSTAYFDHLRARLGLEVADHHMLKGWNDVLVGPMPDIEATLARLAGRIPLFAFSNTNKAHVAAWSEQFRDMLSCFEEVYASSTIGLRKPDPAAFAHVVDAMGRRLNQPLAPAEVAFFDDLEENVISARAFGLKAYQTATPAALAAALADLGL